MVLGYNAWVVSIGNNADIWELGRKSERKSAAPGG